MGKEKRLYKSEESESRAEASAFLHRLADQVGEGKLQLGEGEDARELMLPEELVLEVQAEAEKKKGKRKKYSLEIELEWVGVKTEQAEAEESPGESEPAQEEGEG